MSLLRRVTNDREVLTLLQSKFVIQYSETVDLLNLTLESVMRCIGPKGKQLFGVHIEVKQIPSRVRKLFGKKIGRK